MTLSTYIELPAEVEYDYTPAERGRRGFGGLQEEPDFDGEIEITKVTVGGIDILGILTQSQLESIEQEIEDDMRE